MGYVSNLSILNLNTIYNYHL